MGSLHQACSWDGLEKGWVGDGTGRLVGRHDLVLVSSNSVSAELLGRRTRGSTEFNNFKSLCIKQGLEHGIAESNPEAVSGSCYTRRKSFQSLKSEDPLFYFTP